MRWVLFGCLFLLLLATPVAAVQAPPIQFIPAKFTANASVIAYAPVTVNDSARLFFGVGESYFGLGTYGLFPKVGDKWICYFSNTDSESNCGPSPFDAITVELGPETVFNLITKLQTGGDPGNDTIKGVATGSIKVVPTITVEQNGSISILASTLTFNGAGAPVTGVTLDTYYQNLTVAKTQALVFNPQTGFYAGSTQLGPGTYYFSFSANSASNPDDFGGGVSRVVVPGQSASACIAQTSSSGLALISDTAAFDVIVNAGKAFNKTGFKITNSGNTTLPLLAVQIPATLADKLDVLLDNTTLAPNATTFFTVMVKPLQKAVSFGAQVNVTSNGTKVGQISVIVGTSILGDTPSCPAQSGQFTVTPTTWFATAIVGQALSKDFSVSNGGTAALAFNATASSTLSGIQFTAPQIPAGGSGTMTATYTPTAAGIYQGTITVSSASGSQSLAAGIQVFDDASTAAADLKTEVEDFVALFPEEIQTSLETVTEGITSLLDQAETSYASGQYDVAQEKLNAAKERFALYQDVSPYVSPIDPSEPPPGTGPSLTLILIPLVVIIALVVVFMLIKKRGKGGNGKKDDAELESEFSEEPKGGSEEEEEF